MGGPRVFVCCGFPLSYMIHTCLRARVHTVCCFFFFKCKSKLDYPYNILLNTADEKTNTNKLGNIYMKLCDHDFSLSATTRYRGLIVVYAINTNTICFSRPLLPQRRRRRVRYILAIQATLSHLHHLTTLAPKVLHVPTPPGLDGRLSAELSRKMLPALYRMTTCSLMSSTRTSQIARLLQVLAAHRSTP